MLKRILSTLLADPSSRSVDLDDWRLTDHRRDVLERKKFLRNIYMDWYRLISCQLPPGPGAVLELGSGAGFFETYCPGVIKSEVFWHPTVRLAANACALPLASKSLKAIVMTDVLHHIPSIRDFFREAERCLRPGGVVAMIEPWNTAWSNWVYHNLHHEPFEPNSVHWDFATSGPLSGANSALPWMVFERDRARFELEFPELKMEALQVMMPFRYLVSGGLSHRSFAPAWSYRLWKFAELCLKPWDKHLGMFAFIVLRSR